MSKHHHEGTCCKPSAGSCGCSHCHSCGHSQEKESPLPLVFSIFLFIAAILCERIFNLPATAYGLMFAVSVLLAGYEVLIAGLKNLLHFRFDESTLMAIAVVSAFCIGQYSEAAMVAILYNIGEAAEAMATDRSRKKIQSLTQIRPDTARLYSENSETEVPAENVSVGQQIIVHPYERIPLDGEIVSGSCAVDTSALTGESMPLEVRPQSKVLSGTMNGDTSLIIKVTSAFSDSAATRILNMVESASERKSHAENLVTRFAAVYTPVVVALAVLLMALPPLFGFGEFSVWFYRALIFLVASCPCALVISVPVGFFAGIGAQTKIGVLVKGGKYIEALAKADTVAFDKTGTLTKGSLSVVQVISAGKYSSDELLAFAAAAEQISSHPVAAAIRKSTLGRTLLPAENIKEIRGKGILANVNGFPTIIGRREFLEEYEINVPTQAKGSLFIAINNNFEGIVVVEDTPRPEAAKAVKKLHHLGIKHVVMLTGDSTFAAETIAQRCKIDNFKAQLLPEEKAAQMQKLHEESKACIFVGDGINDAPVLACADCGVAMGLGTDAAIEASDMVLTAENLCRLPDSIELARRTLRTIKSNIWFALAVKAIVLVLAAFGYAPMWAAVFADVGVTLLSVLNSSRILTFRPKK